MDINKVKLSFKAVKRDFDVLRITLSDWIDYLVRRDSQLERRIEALEKEVSQLEEKNRLLVATY